MKKPRKKAIRKSAPLHHHVVRHTKTIIRITPVFVHGMVLGAIVGVLLVTGLRTGVAQAVSLSSPRDCDSNAVINCGALTTTELQQRYSYKGVAAIYTHFGISAADVGAMGTTAQVGLVHKNGTVTVGGTVVATSAITAGRENIAGSTKVSSGGVTFYKRAPSVSFRPNSIAAFVVMKDGQFDYAILGACGNPVSATPVPKAKPPTTPVTPTTPPPEVQTIPPGDTVVTVPSTQTPPSTQVASVVTTPETLPNTGPGAVAIIAVASVTGGYIFHATHRHVKHRRRMRREASGL